MLPSGGGVAMRLLYAGALLSLGSFSSGFTHTELKLSMSISDVMVPSAMSESCSKEISWEQHLGKSRFTIRNLILYVLIKIFDCDGAISKPLSLVCDLKVITRQQSLKTRCFCSVCYARLHDAENVSSDEAIPISFDRPKTRILSSQIFDLRQENVVGIST